MSLPILPEPFNRRTSSCPSPTTSKAVRLAVQLQQLETQFQFSGETLIG
jgi:hypothetical protein